MAFKLPDLPYAKDALAPHIDEETMTIHHDKHHNGYVNKLNKAVEGTDHDGKDIEEVLKNLDMDNKGVRNNGGGHFNHSLFWEVMSPNGGDQPSGALADAINDAFGSYDDFKNKFSEAAKTRFGSGWAWLCVHSGGKVEVCSTPNQDNPLMPGVGCGGYPILGLDVWEHAYYLKYQNKRPDYVEAFFNVINWDKVSELYEAHK
jgi:Fe-Mn family superoxide dismutase